MAYGGILGGQSGGGILSGLLDPQVALPIAAQMIGAPTFQQSLAGGFAAAAPGLKDMQRRKAVDAWLKWRMGKGDLAPEQVEYIRADPELASKLFAKETGIATGSDVSLTPVLAKGADGKWGMFQPSRSGVAKQMQFPEGWEPQPPTTPLDLGTRIQPIAKAGGAPIGEGFEKDIAGAASEAAIGKGKGDAFVNWQSIKSKLPGLQEAADQMEKLAEKATYTTAGRIYDIGRKEFGLEPREAAVARTQLIAMIRQQILPLLRDTFGAQFTYLEGEKLERALSDPNVTPAEKKAVLREFVAQKVREAEALAVQAGQPRPSAAPPVEQAPDAAGWQEIQTPKGSLKIRVKPQ